MSSTSSSAAPMSTTVTVHPRAATATSTSASSTPLSGLPQLLHTPLGMALIEIQGTVNHPAIPETSSNDGAPLSTLTIGRLVFPDLSDTDASDGAGAGAKEGPWMKRAWLYVGEHQRLTGEVKKLPTPLGILRRRVKEAGTAANGVEMNVDGDMDREGAGAGAGDELEIADVIRWKVVFSSRPEPVGVV